MPISLHAIKKAAARERAVAGGSKRAEGSADAEIRVVAEAEARKREAKRARRAEKAKVRAEAQVREAVAEANEAGAEAEKEVEAAAPRKRKAVVKEVRKSDAEGSNKRPRSSPESPPPSRTPKEAPIDLTSDTPPRGSRVGTPPPAPETSEFGPTAPADPILPTTERPDAEAGAEKEYSPPDERAPAPDRLEEEGVVARSLRFLLDNNGKWAEQMMDQVCPAEMKRGLLEQGSSSFFRDAFAAHLWSVNAFATLKDILSQAEISLGHSQNEASAALAQVEEVKRALADAQAEKAREQARAEEAEYALEVARRQAEHELDNAKKAEEQLKMSGELIEGMKIQLLAYEIQLQTVTAERRGFEERVENAEEIARDSDARAAEAREAARVAGDRIEAAEQRAAEAVDTFRKSTAYEEEIAESTAYAYNAGFQEGKIKVGRIFNLPEAEIDLIEPDEELSPSPPPGDEAASVEL